MNTLSPVSQTLQTIRERVGQVVVGQESLVERLLLALLCNGHVFTRGCSRRRQNSHREQPGQGDSRRFQPHPVHP